MKKILGLFIAVVLAFSVAGCDKLTGGSSKGSFKFSKEFLDANISDSETYESFTSATEILSGVDYEISDISYLSATGLVTISKDGKYGVYNMLLSKVVVDITFENITFSSYNEYGYLKCTKTNSTFDTETAIYFYDGTCLLALGEYSYIYINSASYSNDEFYYVIDYVKDSVSYSFAYLVNMETNSVNATPVDLTFKVGGASYSETIDAIANYFSGLDICYNDEYLFKAVRLGDYNEITVINKETGKVKTTYKLDNLYFTSFDTILSMDGFDVLQRLISLPDNAEKFDIYLGGVKYNVETVKIDYIKGTVKEIDFDYYFTYSRTLKDKNEEYNYCYVGSARKISDKYLDSAKYYTLMFDSSLKVTDISDELFRCNITKIADDRYISICNGVAYLVNGKLELLANLYDMTTSDFSEYVASGCIIIDAHEVLDSDMKLLFNDYSILLGFVNGKALASKMNDDDVIEYYLLSSDGTSSKLDLAGVVGVGDYFYKNTKDGTTKYFAGSTELISIDNVLTNSYARISDTGNYYLSITTSTTTKYYIINK